MARTSFYSILTATAFAFASGCAWNYAGQEGKTRDQIAPNPDVQVVQLEKKEAPQERPEVVEEPADEPENTSPCGVDSFVTHYFDATTQIERRVGCESRKVSDIQRRPLGESLYLDRKRAGYPEASWYILVDPHGVKEDVLNNANLLKLSQVYNIEFFGRATDGLLVYIFKDEVS